MGHCQPANVKNQRGSQMTQLSQSLECSKCLTYYQQGDHEPLILQCGHHTCSISIGKIFDKKTKEITDKETKEITDKETKEITDKEIKEITCPLCKRKSKYQNKEDVIKNITIMEILQSLKKSNSKKQDQLFTRVNNVVKLIKKENSTIDTFVNEIVERSRKVKEYNNNLIMQINAFKQQKKIDFINIIIGNNKKKDTNEIQQDIKKIRQAYITFGDFKRNHFKGNQIDTEKLKANLNDVKQIELYRGYAQFRENILKYIDNCNWNSALYINQDKLPQIIQLLKNSSKINSDDNVVYSFLLWKGIGIEKDVKKAKQIINNPINKENGRALLLKFSVEGKKDYSLIVRSVYYNYQAAYVKAAFHIDKLTEKQKKLILYYAGSKQSPIALSTLGAYVFYGAGIEQNKLKGAEMMLKAISQGSYFAYHKKFLDKYFDENIQFRQKYPEYKKWKGNYDDFEYQEIFIL